MFKEKIFIKWIHRFGIDSLDHWLIHTSSVKKRNQQLEENQDQTIELRISPFNSGLYFSIGGLSTGRKYQKVTFEKRNRVLPNNERLDATKIIIETEIKPWSGVGLGLGYTAIWDFGLSTGLGLIFSPVQLEPDVSVTADPDISAADKQSLTERVEKDFGKPNPSIGYLAIGYNF